MPNLKEKPVIIGNQAQDFRECYVILTGIQLARALASARLSLPVGGLSHCWLLKVRPFKTYLGGGGGGGLRFQVKRFYNVLCSTFQRPVSLELW